MKPNDKDYFYCYSPKLRRFIHEEHNIKWVDKGVNPKSGYPRWLFLRSDHLDDVIKEYQQQQL